mmetsp:Transcript_8418/g.9722  ORF Transcript_8418/g.9722 Transcript_8418/m.9722 type:complete len:964 (+) Transcript_8418:2-2893(+)
MIVVVSAVILYFVSESANSNRFSNSITNNGSSTNRHQSGNNSRPYQYRRRQRQRRLQKLRKKKTDEWSDDEEPLQNGARLISMNDNILSSLTGGDDGGGGSTSGGYGSPPCYAYEYDYEYDHENNNNYYREPNSHLALQDSRLRKTGTTTTTSIPSTKEPYDYYAVNHAFSGTSNRSNATYKSPAASKYIMQATTNLSTTSAIQSATNPQRRIDLMDSYSSGGSGSRQRRRQHNNLDDNKNNTTLYHSEISNYSPTTGSISSPNWDENNDNNKYKYNDSFTAITTPSAKTPVSGKLRIPFTPDRFTMTDDRQKHSRNSNDGNINFSDASSSSSNLLPAPRHQSSLFIPSTKDAIMDGMGLIGSRKTELGARLLDTGSRFSSFASMGDVDSNISLIPLLKNETNNHGENKQRTIQNQNFSGYGEIFDASINVSQSSHHSHSSSNNNNNIYLNNNVSPSFSISRRHHQQSLLLTPGDSEETPIIGNARKTIMINDDIDASLHAAALLPPIGIPDDNLNNSNKNIDDKVSPVIPYIPSLKITQSSTDAEPPPRSIIMDELRLAEMETGDSTHWAIEHSESSQQEDCHVSFAGGCSIDLADLTAKKNEGRDYPSNNQRSISDDGSDISIPSGDPRKSIIHKRINLTMSTDAATSLQSSINFDELQLQDVIGGGGFGQVWKATWRGTPVAVKVLTGAAQNTHIAKAILEEFKAEINLLKGMRHPNICLYMGACLTPPNRAIITELAANGSAWDSLRLPLTPPYTAADGTSRSSWPLRLYIPGHHGAPPSSHGSSHISAPILPRGTWPWELVKRVSCGAARGMTYLHSGNPPVLHRDLKSANLLLDESYTTKVCDFGLSRLKAQARSMTANCGTVQWMAPEVLANRSYDEKADVYSFGIIIWELLTRECPYEGMTAIQCALAVLNRDKRPEIPKWCPPQLHALIKSCIKKEPSERPYFAQIIVALDAIE